MALVLEYFHIAVVMSLLGAITAWWVSRRVLSGSKRRRFLQAVSVILLVSAIGIYCGPAAMLYVSQDSIIVSDAEMNGDTPENHGWNYEEVRLTVLGEETYGWYVKNEGAVRGTVLFSHVNGGTISDRLEMIGNLLSLDLNVLLYDYGGYGAGTGSPSEKRCYADIQAMWDFLVLERDVGEESVLLWGRSMGGGPTTEFATQVEEGEVILESTFTSVPAMAAHQFPIYPVTVFKLLVNTQFSNIDKVADIRSPLLIVHSRDDLTVPYILGEQLFASAVEPKTFLPIEGKHNSGYFTEGRHAGIREFLDIHLPLEQSGEITVKQ